MKQLKKLKLKDFSEMTDSEMKFVVGGSGSGDDTCSWDGKKCGGSCPDKWEWDNKEMRNVKKASFCNFESSIYSGGSICKCS